MHYLCYDLRGIQSFIFRVPRLAAIISGSALIDTFDREAPQSSETHPDVECVFTCRGKGAFKASQRDALDGLQEILRERALGDGMDIRFGLAESFSEAAQCADDLHAYLPGVDTLTGHPCSTSGLYPVAERGQTHRVIRKLTGKGEGSRSIHFEALLEGCDLGPEIDNENWEFFHDTEFKDCPKSSLGHSRFAVVCMDGNDIGS